MKNVLVNVKCPYCGYSRNNLNLSLEKFTGYAYKAVVPCSECQNEYVFKCEIKTKCEFFKIEGINDGN